MKKEGSGRRIAGNLIIILGLLCALGAGGLTLYNYLDGVRAEKAAADVMEKLADVIGDHLDEAYAQEEELDPYAEDPYAEDDSSDENGTGSSESSAEGAPAAASKRRGRTPQGKLRTRPMDDPSKTPYKDMPVEMIDGYPYIGFLEIPSLGLSLPVMADWDYDRLQISPCRYSGSYFTDDLTICAHNYARHFSPVKWIEMGADVYFTNVNGESIHYITSNIQTVQPTHIDDMIENSANSDSTNEWDMTLFTCNTGGQTRCAVRCTRIRQTT